jgi:hypothetical protein
MTRQRHITVALLAVTLLVLEAGGHPGVILAIGTTFTHLLAWTTDHIDRIFWPSTECPWNPECI